MDKRDEATATNYTADPLRTLEVMFGKCSFIVLPNYSQPDAFYVYWNNVQQPQ